MLRISRFAAMLLLWCSGAQGLHAQETALEMPVNFTTTNRPDYGVRHSRNATDTLNAWYNQAATMGGGGFPGAALLVYLYPDSTVFSGSSGQLRSVGTHSVGQVIDPHESIWWNYNNINVAHTAQWSLDSVALYFKYKRFDYAVPDTLVLQVWDDSGINQQDQGWSSEAAYADVPYNTATRKGANPIYESYYLLTASDTSELSPLAPPTRVQLPVGLPFDTGRAAVTWTFFPGVPATLGDTIDLYSYPLNTIDKHPNTLMIYEFRDETPHAIASDHNMALILPKSTRYGINTFWEDIYVPGTAWSETVGIYHLNMDFNISYQVLDTASGIAPVAGPSLALAPNPASSLVQLNNAEPVTVAVHDLRGRLVLHARVPAHGSLPLEALPAGMYQLRATSLSGGTRFEKLVIQR